MFAPSRWNLPLTMVRRAHRYRYGTCLRFHRGGVDEIRKRAPHLLLLGNAKNPGVIKGEAEMFGYMIHPDGSRESEPVLRLATGHRVTNDLIEMTALGEQKESYVASLRRPLEESERSVQVGSHVLNLVMPVVTSSCHVTDLRGSHRHFLGDGGIRCLRAAPPRPPRVHVRHDLDGRLGPLAGAARLLGLHGPTPTNRRFRASLPPARHVEDADGRHICERRW